MNLNEYQNEALRTLTSNPHYSDRKTTLAILALGVAGEAGEVADHIKKHIGHGHDLDVEKVAKEIGDVLWYLATLANMIGKTLDEVGVGNVMKLRARYPVGFTVEASKSQADERVNDLKACAEAP